MNPLDQPDDEPVSTDLNGRPFLAFQGNGSFGNARRCDEAARRGGQVRQLDLAFPEGNFGRGQVHRFGTCFVDEIDDELATATYGVFTHGFVMFIGRCLNEFFF